MATEVSKLRFVKCPKCRRLLMEVADVPVYRCGGCGTVLQAKPRHANNPSGTPDILSLPENNVEMSHGGDHSTTLCGDPPCSDPGNDFRRGEESNCCVEAGSASNCPTMGEDTISVASAPESRTVQQGEDSCSDEPKEGSWKLRPHGSVNSSSSCKMGELAESVTSEEDMVGGNPGDRPSGDLGIPPARGSHAYDGSISSSDEISSKHERYRLLSRRTHRSRKLSESYSTEGEDGEEDAFAGNKTTPSWSKKSVASVLGISGLKQRSSSRDVAHVSDSKTSYSVRKELEADSLSRSLYGDSISLEDSPRDGPSGIPSNRLERGDRVELLRQVQLLRDHLPGPCAGGLEGDRRFTVGGTRHNCHPPLHSNLEPDASRWRPRSSGQENRAQHRYHYSGVPYSGESSSSCSRHSSEGWQHIPAQLPSGTSYGTCYHSSAVSSCCQDCRASLWHSSETSDHHLGKLPLKEKPIKRRCRPLSGGAPFVVCSSCLQMLQLPADFFVSRRRRHKLKCGACSEVLIFLSQGGHIVPYSGAQLDTPRVELGDAVVHVSNHDLSDPASFSEGYGPPPRQSYCTDKEQRSSVVRGFLEREGETHGKQTMAFALHRLMGISDEIDCDEYEGTRTSSSLPSYAERHEADDPVMRMGGATGDSLLRASSDGDTEELNHRVRNIKLRSHANGRRGPSQN